MLFYGRHKTKSDMLVIIPTKGRPHLIPRVVKGIERAVTSVDVCFVINREDIDDYRDVMQLIAHDVTGLIYLEIVDNALAYPEKLNYAAQLYAGEYDYLAPWNDDHEAFVTGWDDIARQALKDKPFGVVYGPDGLYNEAVAGAPVLTSSMVTAIGWLALPVVEHIRVDDAWCALARWTGTLIYEPKLVVLHHHIDNGEAPMDATYALTNANGQRNERDNLAYDNWYLNQRWIDGDKLRELWQDEADIPPRQFAAWE